MPADRCFRNLLAGASLLVATLGAPAFAADCSTAADQATMNKCAAAAFKAADSTLNRDYKAITARLGDDAAGKKALVKAQRAWLAYRDAECAFQTNAVAGGSIAPMIQSDCMTALTQARVADFKGYLSCPEGDLSCPLPPAN